MEAVIAVMILVVVFFIGFLIGKATVEKHHKKNMPDICGTILIETSDPDGPYLFLDLEIPIDQIGSRDLVTCKVNANGVIGRD